MVSLVSPSRRQPIDMRMPELHTSSRLLYTLELHRVRGGVGEAACILPAHNSQVAVLSPRLAPRVADGPVVSRGAVDDLGAEAHDRHSVVHVLGAGRAEMRVQDAAKVELPADARVDAD